MANGTSQICYMIIYRYIGIWSCLLLQIMQVTNTHWYTCTVQVYILKYHVYSGHELLTALDMLDPKHILGNLSLHVLSLYMLYVHVYYMQRQVTVRACSPVQCIQSWFNMLNRRQVWTDTDDICTEHTLYVTWIENDMDHNMHNTFGTCPPWPL